MDFTTGSSGLLGKRTDLSVAMHIDPVNHIKMYVYSNGGSSLNNLEVLTLYIWGSNINYLFYWHMWGYMYGFLDI